ncbi:dethiobiotin synthase [Flavobacteriaceae bacterium]|nr:dethiobiotin synthase [Flavobacteriaceae bacterium]
MPKTYFITGIGTDVGKTIASAIVVEALNADYYKPIQAGDLDFGDKDHVASLLSNDKSKIFDNQFKLTQPMSPHAAARIDGIEILAKEVKRPGTENVLVVEGAGGLLVPINDNETIADLIQKEDEVILVSRNYLGSINHSLLSIEYLKNQGLSICGIIFNGEANEESERIILRKAVCPCIGRIDIEDEINKKVVSEYAELFKVKL